MAKTTSKLLAVLLALVLMLSVVPIAAMADNNDTTTATGANLVVQFGDPNYTPTSPEKDMVFRGTQPTYAVKYTGPLGEGNYYPYILAFYITTGNTGINGVTASGMTLRDASNNALILTGNDANAVSYLHDNGFCTIELDEAYSGTRTLALSTSGSNEVLTLTFDAPQVFQYSTTSTIPDAFDGYLPIGQFATGAGWGSPYSNGNAKTLNGTPKLLATGFASTGLSLGAAGGYAEYDFSLNKYETVNGVSTRIKRPYGVDFVVYGNAFNGNPEAGSVKVYGKENDAEATYKWYELAGSLYYSTNTLRNVDVTYKKIESGDVQTGTGAVFTSAGIWYRVDNALGGQEIGWTKFNNGTSVAWWPESGEGYYDWYDNDNVLHNGVYGAVQNVIYDSANKTITYQHVTIVKDTDTTTDYTFGYFDVTPNPDSSSSYGAAINPYSTYVSGVKGGDGYSLDWAVDEYGNPVDLAVISKIRVYTSAAMQTSAKLFTVPAVFGETSAELCGIFAASGTATDNQTSAPTITVGGTNILDYVSGGDVTVTPIGNVLYYNATALGWASSQVSINATPATGTTAIIFINENTTGSYTKPTSISSVRVIAQTGDGAPYIAVIQF